MAQASEVTRFLKQLKARNGLAGLYALGHRPTFEQVEARQAAKRLGLATYDEGYWELTPMGWAMVNGLPED